MKKILFLFVALVSMSASMYADGLTATLQQGDKMTAFYGVNAFKDAYEAASDGAVITLSSGKFNDVATIEKSITIYGTYAFDAASAETTLLGSMTIGANNVKVEGIYFSGILTLGEISDCQIKRCWVQKELTSTATHTNTVVDQCVIIADKAVAKGNNYCIKNSTISEFTGMNMPSNMAYITNCVVWVWSGAPYAIYKNNILMSEFSTVECLSPKEFYYNIILSGYTRNTTHTTKIIFRDGCVNQGNIDNLNWRDYYNENHIFYDANGNPVSSSNAKGSLPADDMKEGKTPLGQDGTVVGIKGGTGFSEYPSIPRIISKEIDSNTDDKGKLNVKITVQAQQ